jgi:hypothetical protein
MAMLGFHPSLREHRHFSAFKNECVDLAPHLSSAAKRTHTSAIQDKFPTHRKQTCSAQLHIAARHKHAKKTISTITRFFPAKLVDLHYNQRVKPYCLCG